MSKNIKLNNTNYNGVSTVQLPTTDGGKATFKDVDEIITPVGTITITENGTHDVTGYASAEVNIESESGGSSEEFVGIKLSGFEDNVFRGQPTVADVRSLQSVVDASTAPLAGLVYLFANNSNTSSGGFFTKLTDIYLPDGILALDRSVFLNCMSLKKIHGDLSGVMSIGNDVFSGCISLEEVPYMPNAKSFGANAFSNCKALTEFKFYSTPTTITNTLFTYCENLTDIYVPWAEGEVSYAPWGAPNATIHYGTTYDDNHNPIV